MSDKQEEVKGHGWTGLVGRGLGCCECGWNCKWDSNAKECREQHAAHLAALASQPEHRETVCAVHHVHLCGICFPGALASQVPAQPPAMPSKLDEWISEMRRLTRILEANNERAVVDRVAKQIHAQIGRLIWLVPVPVNAAPVPAQGTPPAQPQLRDLAGRKGNEIMCRYLCDGWILSAHSLAEELYYFADEVNAPAPASPQVGETLEQECAELIRQATNDFAKFESLEVAAAFAEFIRTKLRAALLVSGDKKVTLLNEDTLLAQEYEYTQPGEAPITANVGAWYSSAVYWRHQTIRLRAALDESEARIAALAESWEKEATGGRKKAIAAARLSGEPLQHFIEYEEALERCAKELRALAAQPTPAPKE